MSEPSPDAPGTVSPTPSVYPYHRDCIKCGYDLFGQPLKGVCPECAAKVQETGERPLWSVTHPKPLGRTRWGLRLISIAFLTFLGLLLVSALASSTMRVGDDSNDAPAMIVASIAIATLVCFLIGVLHLATGAGGKRRRLISAALVTATVVWGIAGNQVLSRNDTMLFGVAIGLSLVWLTGLSLQLLVVGVSRGLPARVANVRAGRFLKVTRLMLFVPVVLMWLIAAAVVFTGDGGMLILMVLLYVLQASGLVVGLWLLLAAIHWLRLLRFLRPPRILPS